MIICWPGSLILLWWYDYNKPRPGERIRHPGLYTQMIMDIQNRRRSKVPDIPDSSKQSTLHDFQALKLENERLRDEAEDADLLLGPSWQEAVRRVEGSSETDVAGSLSIQCSKLSGDLAVCKAENKRQVLAVKGLQRLHNEVCTENKRLRDAEEGWMEAQTKLADEVKRLREENAALQECLENKDCSRCGSKLDIYGVCLSADVHGNCTKHGEAVDWVNTPHQCSPGTCGHQPASIHIDCVDPWHRLPSREISFSCPTCRAA